MPKKITEKQLERLKDSLPLYRKILMYSAQELGSYMGLTRQQISSLETGRTKLTQVHLRALSDIINEIISESEVTKLNIALFVILILIKSNEDELDEDEYLIWINILSQFSNIKDTGDLNNQIKLLKGFAIASKDLKQGDVIPSIEILDKLVESVKNSMESMNGIINDE